MSMELPYTSSIKDMPFLFVEMRRTALLLCQGKTGEEIYQLSMNQNIYQLNRRKRQRDVPLYMLRRLKTIGEPLIDVVANGRESDAKLIALLALIKSDRLFFEFMYEVFSDRYRTGHNEVTEKDYIEFIERKAQNNNAVAKWTPYNMGRVFKTYKAILREAGMAKKSGDRFMIQKPLLDPEIAKLLDSDERAVLLEE